MWQYVCDHNSGKTRLIFKNNFYKQEEHFYTYEKHVHLT